jgi:hypothetical protein
VPGEHRVRVGRAGEVSFAGGVVGVGGSEPTTEDRIAALEREVASLAADRDKARERLRRLEQETSDAVTEAHNAATRLDRDLRRFIHDMLEGGIGMRVWGTALFAVGVVLGVLGNVAC